MASCLSSSGRVGPWPGLLQEHLPLPLSWFGERRGPSGHCLSWLTRAPQLLLRPCPSTGLDLPLLLAVKPQQTSAPGLKDLGLGHKSNWSPAHSVIWNNGSSDLAWSPGGRQGRGCGSSWPHSGGGCSGCPSVSRAAHVAPEGQEP